MTPLLLLFVALATVGSTTGQGILDWDGDGRLSKSEVLSTMTLDQAMLALDSDGDGNFSPIQIYQLTDDPTLYQQLDTDGNGKVSFDEVRAATNMSAIFDREDANRNGYLDGPEADKLVFIYVEIMISGHENWAIMKLDTDQDQLFSRQEILMGVNQDMALAAADDEGTGQFPMEKVVANFDLATFQTMDADGNGRVSVGEFRKVMEADDIFDFYDMNDDDFLEGPEQRGLIIAYNLVWNAAEAWQTDPSMDTDGDRRLSKPEVLSLMTLDQIMLSHDEDGDGHFTEIEVLNFFSREYFARFDTDMDGLVSFAEMRAVIDVGPFFDYSDIDGSGFLENLEQYKVVMLYRTVQMYLAAGGQ